MIIIYKLALPLKSVPKSEFLYCFLLIIFNHENESHMIQLFIPSNESAWYRFGTKAILTILLGYINDYINLNMQAIITQHYFYYRTFQCTKINNNESLIVFFFTLVIYILTTYLIISFTDFFRELIITCLHCPKCINWWQIGRTLGSSTQLKCAEEAFYLMKNQNS